MGTVYKTPTLPNHQVLYPTNNPWNIYPTNVPGVYPTGFPKVNPTKLPGMLASHLAGINFPNLPGIQPSQFPGFNPSKLPGMLASHLPGMNFPNLPGIQPSQFPGFNPSKLPGIMPSKFPGFNPSNLPGIMPSKFPGYNPTNLPGMVPSKFPGYNPTNLPGMMPSQFPGFYPSNLPGMMPSKFPGYNPTNLPGMMPSRVLGGHSAWQNINPTGAFPSLGTAGFHGHIPGRTMPTITDISTIPVFQEARNMPPVSCVNSLAYGGSSPDLLDTQAKLINYRRNLSGDKLALFQTLTGSPDYDLSIFTEDILDEALEHLLQMYPTERDIFFDPRAFLADPTNFLDIDYIEHVFAGWIPKIRLLQTRDVMCDIQALVPYELQGELCDHLLDESVTAIETTLMNERCADCTALLVLERWDGNHTGKVEGIKGRALYAKLRQVWPDWDIYMLRFTPKAVQPSDIDRIDPSNFGDSMQLMVLMEEYVQQRLSSAVKTRIALKLEEAYGPFPTWSPMLHYVVGHYIMFLPATELEDKLEPAMFVDIDIMPEDIQSKDRKRQSFYSLLAWKTADWLSDPRNVPIEFATASLDVKTKFFCLVTKYAALPHLYGTVFGTDIINHGMAECRHYHIDYSQMDFLVDAATSDPGFVWTANAMVDLDPLMPAVPASILKNISAMELKAYWEEKDAEFPVSSVRIFDIDFSYDR
ncbi:endo-1,4-beta-xylanase B-like [Elysia marginata]|uniref:Endo-1,4-beta-xylanase B-like n=1 Tax=Elysia marginata TaxID=1093978 RepID=A0AAV4GU03_9GAST|nr:endo-1,4-beta-xylanase B-like [Elysia marginata]